jgi:hypothetical protein
MAQERSGCPFNLFCRFSDPLLDDGPVPRPIIGISKLTVNVVAKIAGLHYIFNMPKSPSQDFARKHPSHDFHSLEVQVGSRRRACCNPLGIHEIKVIVAPAPARGQSY